MNLSDFFIANPSEVENIDIETSPLQRFSGFESKGVEIVKILTLLSLIDGSDVMENIDNMNSYFVQQSDEGMWIVAVPEAIVSHLSEATDSRIESLAHDWTNTEEWQLDGGSQEDVRWVLQEMKKLSATAADNVQNVYLWICL